jgi:hypothetical protein
MDYNMALNITKNYLEDNPNHKDLLCVTAEIYKNKGPPGLAKYYQERLDKLDINYECKLIQYSSIEVDFITNERRESQRL